MGVKLKKYVHINCNNSYPTELNSVNLFYSGGLSYFLGGTGDQGY